MKNLILTLAATATLLVGGMAMPGTADAQWRRGYAYGYRPYYRSYYRPYYRAYYRPYYRPYYGGYYGYYPRYYYPRYYRYGYPYRSYGRPGVGVSWGTGGVWIR